VDVGVVGAGWTGLALASFLRARGARVHLFEASERVGGRVATRREKGYLVEAGPHGVIPGSEATRELLRGVDAVEAPRRAARFVVHRGRPVPLPAAPPGILTTPLLPRRARLRLLAEPFHGPGPEGETVAAFARRRLGRHAAALADAFVTGVYAGDPERLVLAHAFPEVARMDREGGLLRNLRKGPRPALVAPREGMQAWMDALAEGADLTLRARVDRAEARGDKAVLTVDGREERFDRVVLAVDPPAAARLLGVQVSPPPMAPVSIVAFGMPADAAPPAGYGALAPEREGRFVLGALFESALFPGRAPEGKALVRCLVGGRRHPERTALGPDETAARAWDDLRGMGLVRGEPEARIVLPPQSIPQLERGHDAWLAALPDGPVHVLGIGHRAVGLDALAAQAKGLAERLAP
jgi:oxygen-dependent protoporphyrinogen oxidase